MNLSQLHNVRMTESIEKDPPFIVDRRENIVEEMSKFEWCVKWCIQSGKSPYDKNSWAEAKQAWEKNYAN